MRTGYAIRDKHRHSWLQNRGRVENVEVPVTVWVEKDDEALTFRRLADAKAMLRVVRSEHRRPDMVHIIDPRWRVIV